MKSEQCARPWRATPPAIGLYRPGAIAAQDGPASSAIRALHQLVEFHDWQHNLVFAIVSVPFLWGTHIAWAIEAWRSRHGRHIRGWLDAVAEFEAFSSPPK